MGQLTFASAEEFEGAGLRSEKTTSFLSFTRTADGNVLGGRKGSGRRSCRGRPPKNDRLVAYGFDASVERQVEVRAAVLSNQLDHPFAGCRVSAPPDAVQRRQG